MGKYTPDDFLKAREFLNVLKGNHAYLTTQQWRTLRGQALNGHIDAAYKGLDRLMTGKIHKEEICNG